MLVLFGIILLILAMGIGVLFAMCAELANRIESSGGSTGTANTADYVQPVDRPDLYVRPDVAWPRQFDGIRTRDGFLLIALSTSCSSCRAVAEELSGGWTARSAGRLGLVISAPDTSKGEAFLAEHGLVGIPHIVDEDGAWMTQSLGLSLSPLGLVFIDGRLHQSYAFNQVEPLWRQYTEEILLCAQQNQSEPAGSVAADS